MQAHSPMSPLAVRKLNSHSAVAAGKSPPRSITGARAGDFWRLTNEAVGGTLPRSRSPRRKAGAATALLFLLLLSPAFSRAAQPPQSSTERTRAAFLAIIDRPKVPLVSEVSSVTETNGLVQLHFSFAADARQRVPGILVKSANASTRRPAVIALHGTGGRKEGELDLLRKLAAKGFVAVAIDGRYHGERTKAGKGSAEYNDAILRAFRDGGEHPFYYDTVGDVMRLIDFLETRLDVDPKRIGLIGFSKGGIETYLAAAVEPRIAVAVPCIGVQSFGWALENDAWKPRVGTIQSAFSGAAKDAGVLVPDAAFVRKFYDRVVPGIYARFDGPVMLPLIAPRPLLVINGGTDDKTPIPGLERCGAAARRAYEKANAADRFVLRIQENTGHKVNPDSMQIAIDWFARWLGTR